MEIAKEFPGRTPKFISNRWRELVNPSVLLNHSKKCQVKRKACMQMQGKTKAISSLNPQDFEPTVVNKNN